MCQLKFCVFSALVNRIHNITHPFCVNKLIVLCLPLMLVLSLEAFSASVQCHWLPTIHLTPARLDNMAVSTGFSKANILELWTENIQAT